MKKHLLSTILALTLLLSLTTTAFAATPSTKTIDFMAVDSMTLKIPATVQVTNVVAQEQKDFSFYLSDDNKTIMGRNSHIPVL